MAKFRAPKGYHFSEDGTPGTTWAQFEKVPKSEPVVYEFDTDVKSEVDALRKLIDDEVEGYTDIVEVEDKPAKKATEAAAKKAPAKAAGAKAAGAKAAGSPDNTGDAGGDGGDGTPGDGDGGDTGDTGD